MGKWFSELLSEEKMLWLKKACLEDPGVREGATHVKNGHQRRNK